MNDSQSNPRIDFDQPAVMAEIENDEDERELEIPEELLRLMENEERQIVPHQEELVVLNLGTDGDRQEVKIGTVCSDKTREELTALLREFKDVFAWTYQDMPGLNTDIAEHKLPIKPECKPIQQKLR